MDMLEFKKTEVELMRVQAARMELEVKIMEREQDIARMNDNIKIQQAKEDELKERLKGMKG